MLIDDEQILARMRLLIDIGNDVEGTNANYQLVEAAKYLEAHGFIINHEKYATIVKYHRCELTKEGKELLHSIKRITLD